MNRVWGRESGVGYESGVDIDAPFEAVGVGKHHAIYGCPVGVGGGVCSDYVTAFAFEHSTQYDNSVARLEWNGSNWRYPAASRELPQGKLKGTHFIGGDDGVGAVGAGAGAVAPCKIADSAEEGAMSVVRQRKNAMSPMTGLRTYVILLPVFFAISSRG